VFTWKKRREKIFGHDHGRAMDRNEKARIEVYARAWSAANKKPGQHLGPLTWATLRVLNTLLWKFHNSKKGWCFPSHETIAGEARCAVSTVAKAVQALEAAGILTWAHRMLRVDWHGGTKLVRRSNAYVFNECVGNLENLSSRHKIRGSNSENRRGTPNQDSSYIYKSEQPTDNEAVRAAKRALELAAAAGKESFEQEWLRKRML